MSNHPTLELLEEIEEKYREWKDKGLTPSTLKVGPDVMQRLISYYGVTPESITLSRGDVIIHKWPDNGFFFTGPWNYG